MPSKIAQQRGLSFSIGGMENRLLIKEYDCCINWLEDAIRVLDKKATADLIKIL
ncbi:hypothetical protein Goshw_024487 [Gossypium schwendimanii]|uniref:Uncharacterized protein n=1 Tax=Gossypium schwendimanii TaxID=34291 RepID=A0A7J9LCQ2_GOSSC|nr:hypothetical protein [Gossypium schwendimanii]